MKHLSNHIIVKFVFVCCLLFKISLPLLFGQEYQQTPYEKKVIDIHLKYYAKVFYNKNFSQLNGEESLTVSLMVEGTSFSELPTLVYAGLLDLYMKNPTAAEQLSNSYEKEMKAAEKLKNQMDFERERKRALNGTEMGVVLDKIRKSVSNWSAKREFEKESDWLNRLQTQSEDLFIRDVNKAVSEIVEGKRINASLGEYDSEEELFPITINCIDNDRKNAITTIVKIPIGNAPLFKDEFNNSSTTITFSHSPSNLVQVNNLILPKKMQIEYQIDLLWDSGTYTVDIPYCDRNYINDKYAIEDVVIHFDDLGIENPFLKGSSYNYTKQSITRNSTMDKIKSEQEKQKQKEAEEQKIKQTNDSVFAFVNKSIQSAVSDYNNLLKQYPYDYSSNKLIISIPKELYGENQRLSDTLTLLLDNINKKNIDLRQKYYADSTIFSRSNDSLQDAIRVVNENLLNNPYNINHVTISDSLELSYFGNNILLHRTLNEKKESLPIRQKELENQLYNNLQKENPHLFVSIYFTQHPDLKNQADSQYIECRCNYTEITYFMLDYINNATPFCDCREKKFTEIGYLFKSRIEFDSFYSMTETKFNEELEKRTVLWKDLQAFESELSASKSVSLKKAITSDKTDVRAIVERMAYHQKHCYYEEALTVLFNHNEGLSKEWGKNGPYFKDKAEMYEAYISEDYAKILRTKKKD